MEKVIIRKPVKYLRLKIKSNTLIEIVAPSAMPKSVIDEFVVAKQKWINKKLLNFKGKLDFGGSYEKVEKAKAKEYLATRISFWSAKLNLPFNKLTLRSQKTRWGSCSSKGNISLNHKIFLLPENISDYVIIHELCHTRIMSHSKMFWDLVAKFYPNYNEAKKYLRGFVL